ncbi:hypothetical protein GWK47_036073 [Chionoecetes opilio]|uniref:Uncharacterized protein n=1 Tax=Chionoecetes opilio TaxID=41210 RepID=A0A8J4YTG5_CHIOP|nr:hypothetical protein GWK47_036073 [Chionoecetes opilio]
MNSLMGWPPTCPGQDSNQDPQIRSQTHQPLHHGGEANLISLIHPCDISARQGTTRISATNWSPHWNNVLVMEHNTRFNTPSRGPQLLVQHLTLRRGCAGLVGSLPLLHRLDLGGRRLLLLRPLASPEYPSPIWHFVMLALHFKHCVRRFGALSARFCRVLTGYPNDLSHDIQSLGTDDVTLPRGCHFMIDYKFSIGFRSGVPHSQKKGTTVFQPRNETPSSARSCITNFALRMSRVC